MSASQNAEGGGPRPRLGQYELQSKLGGTMLGTVFRAVQLHMDRPVLLIILSDRAKDPVVLADLMSEVRKAANVSHPNLCRVFEVGEADGRYYVASEYVPGETLVTILKRRGTLPPKEALAITKEIASALKALADAGVVHGRVHPAHVVITPDGSARLAGVGLGRTLDRLLSYDAAGDGAPLHYISPEQARREPLLDSGSDMYSLGAVLYRMVAGSAPFGAPSAAVVLARHMSDQLSYPPDLQSDAARPLRSLIDRMMAKEANERFASFGQVLEAIDQVSSGRPPYIPGLPPLSTGTPPRAPTPVPAAEPVEEPAQVRHEAKPELSLAEQVRRRQRRGLYNVVTVFIILLSIAGGSLLHPKVRAYVFPQRPIDAQALIAQEYEAAVAYALANPANYAEAFRRFRQIQVKAPGSPYEQRAEQEIQALLARQEQAAQAELATRKQTAAGLIVAQHYGEAVKVMRDFPGGLQTVSARKAVGEEISRIGDEAQRAYDRLREEASRLADSGDLVGAASALEPALSFGFDSLRLQAESYIKMYRSTPGALGEAVSPLNLAATGNTALAYGKVASQMIPHLAKREYLRALRVNEDTIRDPFMKPEEARLKQDMALADAANQFWKQLEQDLPILKGQTCSIKGFEGTVVEVKDGWITFASGGKQVKQTIDALAPEEAVDLYEKANRGNQGAFRIDAALFLAASGAVGGADVLLEMAKAEGADIAEASTLVEHLKQTRREADAYVAWETLGKRMNEQAWNEAASLAQQLRADYAETAVVKAITGKLAECERWMAAILAFAKALHVPVDCPARGWVQASYDFSDPAQMKDWHAESGKWEAKWQKLMYISPDASGCLLHSAELHQPAIELSARAMNEDSEYGAALIDPEAKTQYVVLLRGVDYHVRTGSYPAWGSLNELKAVRAGSIKAPTDGDDHSIQLYADNGKLNVMIDSVNRFALDAPGFNPSRAGIVATGLAQIDRATLKGTLGPDGTGAGTAAISSDERDLLPLPLPSRQAAEDSARSPAKEAPKVTPATPRTGGSGEAPGHGRPDRVLE